LSREEVLDKLELTERQVKCWEEAGFVRPLEAYSFREVTALRTLANMKAARVPSARIRKALQAIREKLEGVDDPLTQVRVYLEGKRIRVQVGEQRMVPESGQFLLDLEGNSTERMVALAPRPQEDAAAKRRKVEDAERWFLRGVEYEQTGAPIQEAIDAYTIAVSLDPDLAAALVNLGTIYFTSRDWNRAEKFYQRAIDANPKYPLAFFNMANLHDELGRRDRALHHYLLAIRLDSRYADAHYNIALLYQNTGEAMKAIRHWRQYLKLDPASSWADVARRQLGKLCANVVVKGRKNPA
jgi:tetratricopeptide (TPR) repeat protein